jgi:dipeptidyl aminopeptidase/acylaminoacyl peptidase
MDSWSRAGLRLMLALASQCSVAAHLSNGPGFDPTPVQIPSIPKTAQRPMKSMDLLNLRDLHGIQISPDGKYVAFVLGQAVYGTNSYRSGLFVVGTEKSAKLRNLGTAGPPHWDDINQWWPENPQWSPDSKYIYYRLTIVGTWQVWRWSREGGLPVQVTHLKHNVLSFQVSLDGKEMALSVERPSLIDKKQIAEHGILYDGSIQPSASGPFLDQIVEARGVETETWMHALRDGGERKATQEESKAYSFQGDAPNEKLFSKKELEEQHVMSAKVSPDGNSVAYQRFLLDPSESADISYPLFVKPTGGGGSVPLTPGIYYAAQYWWSPDSKEIYYTEYSDVESVESEDPRPSKLMVVSAKGGTPRQILDWPDLVYDFAADRSGRFLAGTHENSTSPPEVMFIDLSAKEARVLVNVNPEFQNLQLSPAKRIDASDKNGDHFWWHLVLPLNYQEGKRYPLIVTGYRDGDGFLRGGAGDEYPIQVFAANGFAVLNFDVGRVPNYKSGDFETAILQWQSPVLRMESMIGKLTEMGIVDRAKIGITGFSHGAEMVEYAITHTDLFQAAVASDAGSRDPCFFYISGNVWHKRFADMGVGGWPEGKSSSNWHRLSPALNADRVHAPFLANAADSEYLAGLQFVTSLEQLGKPVEMFVYSNQLHEKNQPKHRYEIYERNVDWFKFWLKDEEDPDPTKAPQYIRWHELRKLQETNP